MVVVGAMCLVIVGNRDHLNVVMTHLVSKSAVLNWSSFSALNPTKYICIYIYIYPSLQISEQCWSSNHRLSVGSSRLRHPRGLHNRIMWGGSDAQGERRPASCCLSPMGLQGGLHLWGCTAYLPGGSQDSPDPRPRRWTLSTNPEDNLWP